MPGVFPNYPAPVNRNTDTGREVVTMRRDVTDRWQPCCKHVQVGRRPQHATVSSAH